MVITKKLRIIIWQLTSTHVWSYRFGLNVDVIDRELIVRRIGGGVKRPENSRDGDSWKTLWCLRTSHRARVDPYGRQNHTPRSAQVGNGAPTFSLFFFEISIKLGANQSRDPVVGHLWFVPLSRHFPQDVISPKWRDAFALGFFY